MKERHQPIITHSLLSNGKEAESWKMANSASLTRHCKVPPNLAASSVRPYMVCSYTIPLHHGLLFSLPLNF